MVEQRYRALRVIATICRVAGALLGVLVVLAALGICLNLVWGTGGLAEFGAQRPWWSRPDITPWWSGPSFWMLPRTGLGLILAGLILLGGGLQALMFYGFGELIHVLLALEENTRATAAALQQQRG